MYDSSWDVMSGGGDFFGSPDPTYGRLGTHTIAYHKDKLGWIAAARRYTAAANSCQVITMDYLSQVPPTSGTYLMAQIATGTNRFYTVEARKNLGYDNGRVPGQAIVIHDVLTTRSEPAHVVDATLNDDPNDAGAMWLPGETFTGSGVTISVLAATTDGWSVQITHRHGRLRPVRGPLHPAHAGPHPRHPQRHRRASPGTGRPGRHRRRAGHRPGRRAGHRRVGGGHERHRHPAHRRGLPDPVPGRHDPAAWPPT